MSNKTVTNVLVHQLADLLRQHQLRCVVAESCTGGSLAAAMTEVPGSSDWFERGFVTYSNAAKEELLDVPAEVILSQGAVSEATACAMAHGALLHSHANLSVAITGIAGPGGGSLEKPVGTVWIAWADNFQTTYATCYCFKGTRAQIRQRSVQAALQGLIQRSYLARSR